MSESMRLAGRALQEKMQRRPYGLYNAAITELGLLLLVATVISSWPDFSKQLNPELFVFLVAAAFLASLAPVPTASGVQLTVALAPLLAAVLSLPAGMATLAGVIGTIDKRIPGRSIAWHRWFYNRGQYALIYGFAAIVYRGLVGLQPDSSGNLLSPGAVSAAVIAIVTVIALNSFLLVTSVAVATHEPIVRVAYRTLEGSILTYAGLAPMGVVMAVLLYVVNPAPNNFYVATLIFILLLVYRELTRQALQVKRVAQGSYVAQSRLIDKKDGSTFGHSERVGLLAEAVAGKMGLQLHLVEQIRIGATLHDLGKIAIPDHILHKTGTLDEEDIAVLRTHPDEGFEVLKEQGVLSEAAKIVRSHHENYDGSGYPLGLTGREIPVGARIARVVDSYDTMTNERIYRRSVKDAFEALSEL